MALKEKGKIVEWNTSRSFGFIRSQFNSNDIFIHISDFKDKQYKPKIGDIIDYEVGTGKDNKKKAIKAIQEGKFSSIHTYKKTSRKERKLYILLILLPFFLFLFFYSLTSFPSLAKFIALVDGVCDGVMWTNIYPNVD